MTSIAHGINLLEHSSAHAKTYLLHQSCAWVALTYSTIDVNPAQREDPHTIQLMHLSTAQHSTAQHSTAQYSTAQHSTTWHVHLAYLCNWAAVGSDAQMYTTAGLQLHMGHGLPP